ncbi:hypothetical protein GCM10010123_27880 [Pilimelia anulata]|uniref:DUF4230 domain-containing protein n=1 Tax=Pilimelia anulata TaxID=53371 RepID=A0A8J3F9A6_9ACTN|nr:DUF4230 domain-containing protein [Pilimelia anulata]GGJ96308.1 hypothetical protein GCM10010123_27880 [Pilimelia anulata]
MTGHDALPDSRPDPLPPAADSARPRIAHWRGFLPAALIVVLIAVGAGLGALALSRFPRLGDWLGVQTVDRSQPVLLRSVRDLSRLVAAEGSFQVVVDLQRNRKYVPDFLLRERTLFVGAGTVDAYVELGALSGGAVAVGADRRSATVRLPEPQLAPARLDLSRSYVFAEQRGVLNRLNEVFGGNPDRQREVFALGERRITEAAGASGLVERARTSAQRTVESLLRSLGYTSVTVSFGAS